MQKQKIPVAAVVGPTASGKSRLAVEIALQRGGEVISADSMQVYRDMLIGTARPSKEEMRGVVHHLIGFADASQPFSAAEYVKLASECICEVDGRGKLPVLAGGTGLYVRSLLHNVHFTETNKDNDLREQLAERAQREGTESLLDELRTFDPESAARIHPNNVGRVVRAIEIYRTTGITMTEQIARSKEVPSPYHACIIGLDFLDRQKLYDRINSRVDQMMEAGLEDEARCVIRLHPQTAAQAIGYKEFKPYFDGTCALEEVVEHIKQESRHYAKRQLTWFRRDEEIYWIHVDEHTDFESVVRKAMCILKENL